MFIVIYWPYAFYSAYFYAMVSVVLIGTGNVAKVLFKTFNTISQIQLIQVIGRSDAALEFFGQTVAVSKDFGDIPHADICLLAVKDEAITEVARKITNFKGLVAHVSGTSPMDILRPNTRIGVFYPLQTFTPGRVLDFTKVPLCIEAEYPKDQELLLTLGRYMSRSVHVISSEERKKLHVAAVFVNNFSNFMYTIGNEICEENGLDFNLLKPLINETAKKLKVLSPYEAQTGPARRGDTNTMHEHLRLLKNEQQREIYILLSNAIKADYG